MRNILHILLFIFIISPLQLKAQKSDDVKLITPCQSYFIPLKHDKADSLLHIKYEIIAPNRYLRNRHISNPAVRYSIENLKGRELDDKDVEYAIKVLQEYAEDPNIKYMVEQLRDYFETIGDKESAIGTIKRKIHNDSLLFYDHIYENDIEYGDDVFFRNQDLVTLVTFMESDKNYLWLREKSRDSVLLTLLDAKNQPHRLWVNTGSSASYRISSSNFIGDSIDTWVQIYPKGNILKFHLPEGVSQDRIKESPAERDIEPLLLSYPDSVDYSKIIDYPVKNISRTYWSYYTDVKLDFGQGYKKNWSKGGENSLSLKADIQYFANYKKNNITWDNRFRYRIGALKSGSENINKNEDLIEISSKAGYKAFKHWNYEASLDFNTILFKSYNDAKREKIVGNFLTPAYLTVSVGMAFKPNNNFSLSLSPIAGKLTYLKDTVNVSSRYGVEKGKRSKFNGGAKLDLKDSHNLFNFIKVDNRFVVFASYDDPVTVNWELEFTFVINYFMGTTISTHTIYDRNASKRIQFMESLNLRINFRF